MDRNQMEQKLARRPSSPLFARLADEYARAGKTEEAKELLSAGLEKYPAYPAAHLVLARCYAAEENFTEAIRHLRTSDTALPEIGHLLRREAEWERLRQPPAPGPAADEQVRSAPAEVLDAVYVAVAPEETIPEIPSEATSVRRPEAHRIAQAPFLLRPQAPKVRHERGRIEDGRIVSKTLAEIYAMQGEYGEAIITYTMLGQQRPQLIAECDLRISELEQALQAKLNQQKIALTR